MSQDIKHVLIAALDREIAPLVRGWATQSIDIRECVISCWRRGTFVVVPAGAGMERARKCTEVVIETFAPEVVTSIGFAGALAPHLAIADVLVPARVVSSKSGNIVNSWFGTGTLVTADVVAGRALKADLRRAHVADAVDMEAAGVAEACAAAGTKFLAVKAISDGSADEMDFVSPYLRPDGFRTGAFLAHVAIRPGLWGSVRKLKDNSHRASESLCRALRLLIEDPEGFERRYAAAAQGVRVGSPGKSAAATKGEE